MNISNDLALVPCASAPSRLVRLTLCLAMSALLSLSVFHAPVFDLRSASWKEIQGSSLGRTSGDLPGSIYYSHCHFADSRTAHNSQSLIDLERMLEPLELDDDNDVAATEEYLIRLGFGKEDDDEHQEMRLSKKNSSMAAFLSSVRPVYRPPYPCASAEAHYLSYNPHSGMHNQRIQLENALVLAELLNRTLLLPSLRLGQSLAWDKGNSLQHKLEQSQKLNRRGKCKDGTHIPKRLLANLPTAVGDEDDCADYTSYTDVSWDWLVSLADRYADGRVRIVDRVDLSRKWMELPTGDGGLGMRPSDIRVFEDESVGQSLCPFPTRY